MAVVTVSVDLEHARAALFAGPLHGIEGLGAHFVKIFAVDDVPIHVIALGALGQVIFDRRGPGEAGAHRVLVVFDDVNDGNVPERGEVERLVKNALVDRAVAEVGKTATFEALVFEGESDAETERRLAGHDAVPAPVIFVRREKVHRPALALRATGGLAEEFGHAFIHRHADHEGVSVVAVSGDGVVVRSHEREGADGDGFLADIQMQEAAHFALLVKFQRRLLEAADAQHVTQEGNFLLGSERRVDGGLGVIFRFFSGFGLGGAGYTHWEKVCLRFDGSSCCGCLDRDPQRSQNLMEIASLGNAKAWGIACRVVLTGNFMTHLAAVCHACARWGETLRCWFRPRAPIDGGRT